MATDPKTGGLSVLDVGERALAANESSGCGVKETVDGYAICSRNDSRPSWLKCISCGTFCGAVINTLGWSSREERDIEIGIFLSRSEGALELADGELLSEIKVSCQDKPDDTLLPLDRQWPFLLRFPIVCFGVSLGLGSQTILWKNLGSIPSLQFLHVPLYINLIIWCLALISLISIFITYSLKCIFYFEAVKREYYHPVRINFFFAPWIACMYLALGVPSIVTSIAPTLSCLFMVPVLILELKIYGQWLLGGDRRLSKVANPSTHLAVVGNFVGSFLAATVRWKELAIFFWAVGLAHYLVLLVTLYQRLPIAELIPKDLHPIFFLFIAAPNVASTAWETIVGDFDFVSRISLFLGLFFYSCLVVRLKLFRGFRFSVSWWAYTYPMTSSANATMHYCNKVRHPFVQGLAVLLSLISVITVFSMLVSTLSHAFLWGTLFPNDMAISITARAGKKIQCENADTGSDNFETSGSTLLS